MSLFAFTNEQEMRVTKLLNGIIVDGVGVKAKGEILVVDGSTIQKTISEEAQMIKDLLNKLLE